MHMINIFALVLATTTFITGVLWFLEYLKNIPTIYYLPIRLIRKYKNFSLKTEEKKEITTKIDHKSGWMKTCSSIFPVLLLVFIVRSFIIEPFQIPSGSMMPTLLVGDFILVKKFAYGIKNPITQITLIETNHPKRGDVVVFKYPINPKLDYIKRVIGIPGDLVRYDPINKRIMVYPNYDNKKNYTMTLPITYRCVIPNNFAYYNEKNNKNIDNFLQISSNLKINNNTYLIQRKESLNGIPYSIFIIPGQQDQLSIYYQQPGHSLAEWIVPQGEYFMMGDNRDNSSDSRYWGFVPERNLIGKAIIIWMSFDKLEGEWPTGIRLNRISTIH